MQRKIAEFLKSKNQNPQLFLDLLYKDPRPECLCLRGFCLEYGIGGYTDFIQSFDAYRKSAELGDTYGQNFVGRCYRDGIGTRKDPSTSFYWYKKSAESNNSTGCYNYADCFKYARGTARDDQKAFEWYKKSAKTGNATGQYDFGHCFENGKGTAKDVSQALYWYEKSAEGGNTSAQCALGHYLRKGIGTEANPAKAFYWFEKSAKAGYARAQSNLGYCYENGIGTEPDINKAFFWYQESAKGNDIQGSCYLGYCFHSAIGTKKDKNKTFYWYSRAAVNNDSFAQCKLGGCFHEGRGTPVDVHEAIRWFRKARENNYVNAEGRIRSLFSFSLATAVTSTKKPKRVRQIVRKPWKSHIDIFTFPASISTPEKANENKNGEHEEPSTKPAITHRRFPILKEGKNIIEGFMHTLKLQAISAFMPKGYPDSVTKDYWNFTKWQFLNKTAGSVTGVLSTQSLLYAMGLGAQSVPLAAALNWIVKDGLGQLGGVIYAATINSRFDSEPKRYRFQATLYMQFASLLELVAPLYPHLFLLFASTSNVGKNICWLAGAASRAQMTKTFALRDNLGDITGKSRSQGTAAGLLGTGIGIAISATITAMFSPAVSVASVAQPVVHIFLTFIPFSLLNIYAAYRSNTYVTSSTLNIQRTEMILYPFFKEILDDVLHKKKNLSLSNEFLNDVIPTPKEISLRETFVRKYRSIFRVPLVMEPTLQNYVRDEYADALKSALQHERFLHSEEYFILHVPEHHLFEQFHTPSYSPTSKTSSQDRIFLPEHKQHIALWYSVNAKPIDLIKGFYHACALRYVIEHDNTIQFDDRERILVAIRNTHMVVEKSWVGLLNELIDKKWDIEHLFLTETNDHRLIVEDLNP